MSRGIEKLGLSARWLRPGDNGDRDCRGRELKDVLQDATKVFQRLLPNQTYQQTSNCVNTRPRASNSWPSSSFAIVALPGA
jgi:hypothetical protein